MHMCSRKELKMSTEATANKSGSPIFSFNAVAWCGSVLIHGLFTALADRPNLWWCHLQNFHPMSVPGATALQV